MILETITRDHKLTRSVLPGATLHYGNYGAVAKGVCLLWALFLVAGPFFCDLRWLVSKVAGITTDFGVEMKTIELPFILSAFIAWHEGRDLLACRPLVDHNRRLFQYALRLSGWGHLWGNLMKSMAENGTRWETSLTQLRAMVAFLRVASWRKTIQRFLKARGIPDAELAELDHFSATTAKWRYQTIAFCMASISRCRAALAHVVPEMFANVKDRVTIEGALNAINDEFFLPYVTCASREVFGPAEGCRHWGMVCPCHVAERHEGKKHIHCWRNGKRLAEVRKFVKDQIAEVHHKARHLPLEAAENRQDVHKGITFHLMAEESGLRMRSKYYSKVPWLFSEADTAEGAEECMKQVRSIALELHDPLTQLIVREIGGAVDVVAEGGDPSPAVAARVEFMKLASLEEGWGGGLPPMDQHGEDQSTKFDPNALKAGAPL